jgi:hypothetical protein
MGHEREVMARGRRAAQGQTSRRRRPRRRSGEAELDHTKKRPAMGLREAFPFIFFLPFLFFYFLLSNSFTIMSHILNGYTPKQNIRQKQIYFSMIHQSLFH